MTACYLGSSFPSMLHLAYKYASSPEEALLANTNTGGENVARGAVLGVCMYVCVCVCVHVCVCVCVCVSCRVCRVCVL